MQNKREQFIKFLEGLKTQENSYLIESVLVPGFDACFEAEVNVDKLNAAMAVVEETKHAIISAYQTPLKGFLLSIIEKIEEAYKYKNEPGFFKLIKTLLTQKRNIDKITQSEELSNKLNQFFS